MGLLKGSDNRFEQVFRKYAGRNTPHTINEINRLGPEAAERIYSLLVPPRIYEMFRIDPDTLRNPDGQKVVKVAAHPDFTFATIEVRERPEDRDCIFFLEIEDTPLYKIEINFLIINDPRSPRFDIDVDELGRRTKFATVRRNIPEEIRAMEAGLAPGQVRRGLRMLKDFVPIAADFVKALGQDMVIAEPLTYSSAILLEHYGFNYIRGKRKMEEIHRGFQPGGELYQKLDGSTPFRQPGMEKTVRGRAWAIHDGILGEPWRGIEMYRTEKPAGVCTFPGWVY
ncbi:MAG: hypothetical protein WHT46_06140 [Candidatus Geothermincolales bacterium]